MGRDDGKGANALDLLSRLLKPARRMRDGLAVRQSPVRPDLREWHQHEGAQMHPWMRQDEPFIVQAARAEKQQIEIERAWCIVNPLRALAPVLVLKAL